MYIHVHVHVCIHDSIHCTCGCGGVVSSVLGRPTVLVRLGVGVSQVSELQRLDCDSHDVTSPLNRGPTHTHHVTTGICMTRY